VTQAATGLFVTLNSGTDVILEESEPVIATRFPIIPDEMYYNDVLEPNDRLVLSIRNSTAAAIISRSLAQITFV